MVKGKWEEREREREREREKERARERERERERETSGSLKMTFNDIRKLDSFLFGLKSEIIALSAIMYRREKKKFLLRGNSIV